MLFDIFKQYLQVASTSATFKAQNLVAQDAAFAASVANHLSALSADFNIRLTSDDVLSTSTDEVANDEVERVISFDSTNSEEWVAEDNFATFNALNFPVNISIGGYIVQSDLPNQDVIIDYRTAETSPWHRLQQLDNVPGSKYLQFRVRISPDVIGGVYSLRKIVIIGRQE